jgi:hypothetical protein
VTLLPAVTVVPAVTVLPAPVLAAASARLHFVTAVAGVLALLSILRLVRRRQLRAKYALLWLVVGVAFLVLGASPGLLDWAAKRLGVAYAPDLLFLVGTVFLVLVVMHLSWELSRLEDRTKLLAEEVALMRTELRAHTEGTEGTKGTPPTAASADRRPRAS